MYQCINLVLTFWHCPFLFFLNKRWFTQATGSTRAAETDVRSTSSGCITVHSLHSVLVAMGQIVEWPCGLRFVGFSMSIHFNCGSQKHRIMMSWLPTNVHHRWAPSPQLVGQMPISFGIKSFDVGCDFFSMINGIPSSWAFVSHLAVGQNLVPLVNIKNSW